MTFSEIYTIGHSNVDAITFLDLLKEKDIFTLIDVRSSPFSKYAPHFNREELKKSLEQRGIEYIYMGDRLGGKPSDSSCYVADKVSYPKIANKKWYQDALSQLIEISSSKKTTIMCSEEDPSNCHRNLLISQSLLNRGLAVMHIRADGQLEKAKINSLQTTLY